VVVESLSSCTQLVAMPSLNCQNCTCVPLLAEMDIRKITWLLRFESLYVSAGKTHGSDSPTVREHNVELQST